MSAQPMIGTVIASHRIEAIIGEGGFSTVYRASHVRLPRTRALKILTVSLAHDESFRERFERESRIAAELDHPSIVEVIDAGDDDGRQYILMRYIDGEDLAALLTRKGPLAPQRAISILKPVAEALDAAHEHGLVHRDVKPQNILIANDGRVYLSDFGIAKVAAAAHGPTRTGMFVGTPDYAAPEQFEARPLDRRTDVYALGGVLYTTLTGAVPYQRTSDAQVMTAHMSEPPPRASELRPELPLAVDDVIAKAMAKSNDDRFDTCSDLVAGAASALSGGPRGVAATAVPTAGAAAPTQAAAEGQSVAPRTEVAEAVAPRRRWNRRWLMTAAVGGVLLVAAAVVAVLVRGESSPSESLTLNNASVRARWSESELVRGRIAFSGSVGSSAVVTGQLRSAGGGRVAANGDVPVRDGGSFSETLPLAGWVEPGDYRFELSGSSGDTTLPSVVRTVPVPSPAEGFVDQAYASALQDGVPTTVFTNPRRVWARFHFSAPPRSKAVNIVWRTPSAEFVGQVRKPYQENVDTFIQWGTAPETGNWSAILSVNGRVTKRVFMVIR